jgi:hypothetical protein
MILITGGCSFSAPSNGCHTWPEHLTNELLCESHHTGVSSTGNGIITKRVLLELSTRFDQKEELLVGIMWSGPDRSESYTDDSRIISKISSKNTDGWQVNPLRFPKDDPGAWVIHNTHWSTRYARHFYKNYNQVEGSVNTFQSILLMQTFLERHNIKYFMSNFTANTFSNVDHPSVSYFNSMIDYNKFLNVEGCMEWCRDNTEHNFDDGLYFHPTKEQHLQFTQQVIMPHLQDHKLI